MRSTQEDKHWHGEDEPIPADKGLENGLLPDGYEEFFPDGYEGEDMPNSTEETASNQTTQLTDDQEDNVKSMPRKKLEKILDELDKEQFNAPVLCSTIREAVTNVLRKFVHEDLSITELESKRDPNQPTLRYITNAKVFEMFPRPEPKPIPERKPIDLIKRLPKNKPTVRHSTDAEVSNLFPRSKPQPESQPVLRRKLNEVSNITDYNRKSGWKNIKYGKDATMHPLRLS